MTRPEMVDNLDGVLSDISHMIDARPSDDAIRMLRRMKLTLARVADAIEHWDVNDSE